jgi:hypothetical protein
MSSRSLGTLTLDLVAKIGGYEQGLDKAEKEAKKRAAAIEKAFDDAAKGIGIAFGAIAAAGVAAFAGFQAATQFVGDFQDLADKTGASAEGLASFAVAAGTAGVSMDEIAGASVKLTKGLTGVDDESKAAGAALSALGISIEDFKNLSPEDQLEEVAKQLDSVGNSADQVAIAMDLFGKSGAQIIPFLKTLNEQGGRNVILTAEMIKQADDYADSQAKAATELKLYAGVLASQALPAVTDLTKAVSDSIKEVLGLNNGVTDLKNNKGVQSFAEDAVDAIATVGDAAQGLKVVFSRLGEFIGATGAALVEKLKGNEAGVEAIRKAYDESLNTSQFSSLRDAVAQARKERKELERLAAQENRGFIPGSPRNYGGANTPGPRGGGSKKDPTAEAQRYIESLQKQLEKTQELTVYEQALKDIQMGRIGQVTEAQKELILSTAKQVDALKEQKKQEEEMKKYKEALDDVNARLLEMQGNTAEAAAVKFDKENSALYLIFSAQGDESAKKKLDMLKELTVAAAKFQQAEASAGKAQTDLQRAEERISRDRELGISGEIDSLLKLGEVRKKALEGMQNSYAEFQKLQASGVQFSAAQSESMRQLAYEIEDLSTRLDPLGEKFNTMLGDKFADAFGSILDGTKDVKTAFKDMFNSIAMDLTKLIISDAFKQLIGGGGSLTGGAGFNVGGFISSLLSGARAEGGVVLPNSLYKVNERGPEMFQAANGSQYLMTGKQGGSVKSGGGTVIVNVQAQTGMTHDTALQQGRKIAQGITVAQTRNG